MLTDISRLFAAASEEARTQRARFNSVAVKRYDALSGQGNVHGRL